jgi:serine-type D-Ala-D-Ala carboxypeptidase (penicillin-binding protein 5/6)
MQNRTRQSTRRSALAVAAIMLAASAVGLTVASAGATSAAGVKPAGAAAARGNPGKPTVSASGKPIASASADPTAPPQPLIKDQVGGAALAGHGIVVNYPSASSQRLPRVPASAYVIADAGTGAVLAAKDAHGLYPPASTLKVLTALTMLPRLNPNSTVLATKLAASVEPNVVGIIPGRRYKVSDLFNALLLISANDAAVALVQAAGSFSAGMALVNAEAHHLQAYDVVAKQPNGLPAAGQVVSAYDNALIARQAVQNPAFMTYDSTLAARFLIKRHKRVTLVNQNYLLTQYKGGIGGKIGWTEKAEATYIGLARRNGVTLIVTILHATSLTEIHSAEKLLNWGFAMDGLVKPVGVLVPPLAAPHPGPSKSADAHAVSAALSGASRGSSGGSNVGLGIAAGFAVAILGSLAWFGARRYRTRHGSSA